MYSRQKRDNFSRLETNLLSLKLYQLCGLWENMSLVGDSSVKYHLSRIQIIYVISSQIYHECDLSDLLLFTATKLIRPVKVHPKKYLKAKTL